MFQIVHDTIRITKGDSATLNVRIVDPATKQAYELKDNDKIYLSVKSELRDSDYAFQSEGLPFVIDPEMTYDLEPGQYYYDIKLIIGDTNENITLTPPRPFILLDGVTGYLGYYSY